MDPGKKKFAGVLRCEKTFGEWTQLLLDYDYAISFIDPEKGVVEVKGKERGEEVVEEGELRKLVEAERSLSPIRKISASARGAATSSLELAAALDVKVADVAAKSQDTKGHVLFDSPYMD